MPSASIIDHPPISAEERTLRLRAVDQARASVRLEGTVLPLAIEELNRQYVDGQWSTSEHVQKVIAAADAMARKCVSSGGGVVPADDAHGRQHTKALSDTVHQVSLGRVPAHGVSPQPGES